MWTEDGRTSEASHTINSTGAFGSGELKKIFLVYVCGGGGGVEGQTDEQAQTNLPLNFFKVGGITMHNCTSYDPDKLHL